MRTVELTQNDRLHDDPDAAERDGRSCEEATAVDLDVTVRCALTACWRGERRDRDACGLRRRDGIRWRGGRPCADGIGRRDGEGVAVAIGEPRDGDRARRAGCRLASARRSSLIGGCDRVARDRTAVCIARPERNLRRAVACSGSHARRRARCRRTCRPWRDDVGGELRCASLRCRRRRRHARRPTGRRLPEAGRSCGIARRRC